MPKSSRTDHRKYLIVLSGPTAIGKTGLAVFLAKNLKTEILSCDSRQFYREMKIGTAKPTNEELQSVKHHFIGNLSIHQTYTVGDFEHDALDKLEELFQKYDFMIMVGGSGLYEKAVTEGLDEFPEIDQQIRKTLNQEFKKFGIEPLQNELRIADFAYYSQVDVNNHQRIIRALEVIRGTGKTFSHFRNNTKSNRKFEIIKIGLQLPREELYSRINQRVDKMIESGLVDEAIELYPFRNLNALQTVGYSEIFAHIDGVYDLETAISEIKKNTRRYAKRQLTWYRKDPNIHWFSPEEKEKILKFIESKTDQSSTSPVPSQR